MTLDSLKGVEIVVGLIALAVSGLLGAMAYIRRRAQQHHASLTGAHVDRQRLGLVEKRLDDVEGHLDHIDDRLSAVERSLETVARKVDIEKLSIAQARMDARLDTLRENDRQLMEQLMAQGSSIADIHKILINRRAAE